MWIVKEVLKGILGVLLGTLLFIVGAISYVWIRVRIGVYLYAQAEKAGRPTPALPYFESDARFWIALLIMIAVGLWIVYRPKRAPTNSQSSLEERAL